MKNLTVLCKKIRFCSLGNKESPRAFVLDNNMDIFPCLLSHLAWKSGAASWRRYWLTQDRREIGCRQNNCNSQEEAQVCQGSAI